jgi:hypothetical protein
MPEIHAVYFENTGLFSQQSATDKKQNEFNFVDKREGFYTRWMDSLFGEWIGATSFGYNKNQSIFQEEN